MAKKSSERKGTPRGDFGPAKKYAREGKIRHHRGWQEETGVVAAGARTAPRAPKGAIPRTPIAERIRQRIAEHEEK